ncbi:unnamed protein product [Eruca vesicaria subsp. sativa]|uniref:RING-type E3 ubiquitin transferase n=1 Tax=Eruca vesicaria subsp. sativa TaxID=29727 RepID=A0ABC8JDQ1_ERUVS|nr:unnamed protein product [Eruca vesicaria subsp. sativa]
MYFNEHNDPLVTFIFAIIIISFMYLAFDLLKNHCCVSRSMSHHIRNRNRNRRPTMVFFVPTNPSNTTSRGLHPAIVNSLPVVTFSSDNASLSDCSVCISEFEEGELVRVLPGCKHTFHVECIDMWFHSHSTCPLCRSLVELPATTVEEQVAITISPEPVVSATEPGSTVVEVSRMSRMVSFTRMLSRDRRSASSSSAGAPSQSEPSSSCGIVMTESDIERGREEIK